MLLPLQCGGGPDEPTKAYLALRSAEGQGGSAPNDSGIDGLWRRSVALGLASGTSAVRRAFVNALPMFATDLLPYYERSLGTSPAPGATDAERRNSVGSLWPTRVSAAIPDLLKELRRIDDRFRIESMPDALSTTTIEGRWFTGSDAVFGSKSCSDLAVPTSRYSITAFLDVDDPGNLTERDERSVSLAEKRLRSLVPSWEDFCISVADGFTLDESPLDWTVLSDE
jgi:hypothetical protein